MAAANNARKVFVCSNSLEGADNAEQVRFYVNWLEDKYPSHLWNHMSDEPGLDGCGRYVLAKYTYFLVKECGDTILPVLRAKDLMELLRLHDSQLIDYIREFVGASIPTRPSDETITELYKMLHRVQRQARSDFSGAMQGMYIQFAAHLVWCHGNNKTYAEMGAMLGV